MKEYRKWLLWIIVIVPAIAWLGGRFITPGPLPQYPSSHYAGRGAQPAKPVQTQSTAQSGQDASSAPSSINGAVNATTSGTTAATASANCPATPAANVVSTGRGRAIATTTAMTGSDLYKLIDTAPQCISRIVFVNGQNMVRVERDGQMPALVKVSDNGGKQALLAKLDKASVPFLAAEVEVDPVAKLITDNFGIIIMVALVLGLFWLTNRQQRKAMGGVKGMGKSRSKDAADLGASIKKVTFNDVAGCEEAVKELRRIVKSVVGADIYAEFGAEMPKGIMLKGPPGTGKTLLARAVAHETDGSFETTSGSDFVEMLVGVGASRVRDLFENARKKVAETKKPHVIFIDEIDAIGGKRGGGASASRNEEREQTLNQLLVEMDGVVSNEGIIVIAATNRVDMLDEALLRPGRFDCHVSVDLPDRAGREAIFAIHIGDRTIASDVRLSDLSHRTYGYSGAEIMGVFKRAATLAAERYDKRTKDLLQSGVSPEEVKATVAKEITLADFDEGIDFVRYGNADPSKQARMRVEDKQNTAYHEAGHAIAGMIAPFADKVVKITIMRRSKALGYVQTMPDVDRLGLTYQQALSRIVMTMAGRCAQEVYLNTVDTGASNDFRQACDTARNMVTAWGMSRLGPISVGESAGAGPFGGAGSGGAFGNELGNEIDREWRYITSVCYKAAKHIVTSEKDLMEALVAELMENETVLSGKWEAMLKKHPISVKWEDLTLPTMELA